MTPTCTAPRTPPPRRRRHCAPAWSASTCPRPTAPRTAVGEERYRLGARLATGADLDLHETYAWGWAEFHRLDQEIRAEADRVLPGASPLAAMAHLDATGPAVEGVAEVRGWLQELMDRAVAELDGTHFDDRGAGAPRRGDDRAGRQCRRAVLHAPVAGLQPPRPHLAADPG